MKNIAQKIIERINQRLDIVPSEDLYNELVRIVLEETCPETFEGVSKPVIEWIAKNKHPHTSIVIDATHAELLEGIEVVYTEEYLQD